MLNSFLMLTTIFTVLGLLFFGSGFIAETIFSKPPLQIYLALAAVFIIFKSLIFLNQLAVCGLRRLWETRPCAYLS